MSKLHAKTALVQALTPLGHTNYTPTIILCRATVLRPKATINRSTTLWWCHTNQKYHSAKYGLWKTKSMSHNFLLLITQQSVLINTDLLTWEDAFTRLTLAILSVTILMVPSMTPCKKKLSTFHCNKRSSQYISGLISWKMCVINMSMGLPLLSRCAQLMSSASIFCCGPFWTSLLFPQVVWSLWLAASISPCGFTIWGGALGCHVSAVCVDLSV